MRRCSETCVGIAMFLAAMALYLPTIATTIGWTDTGELMAVAATLGIAHPTGYPLLTLSARIWLMIPLDLRVAIQLNALSAVFTSAAVALFYLLSGGLNSRRSWFETKGARWPRIAAAGFFATSSTVWLQAASYEVYALHLLLSMGILVTWVVANEDQRLDPNCTSRWWFFFALLVGFGFANHMTTVLLAPALLWQYWRSYGASAVSWRRLGRMVPFSLIGISLYLTLHVRSTAHPPISWGDTTSWESFWAHVGGAQYRVWMFTGWEVVRRQFRLFLDGLPGEFVLPVFAVAAWGMWALWKSNKEMAISLILLAATTILYSVNYDIHEIGPYFLMVYVVVAATVAAGLDDLRRRLAKGSRMVRSMLPALAVAGILVQVMTHRVEVRASNPPLIEQFARSVLEGVPLNAVIITGRWDYLYSPALYLQHVEHVRPDVLVIDHSLLRDHSWYVDALRRRAPNLNSALTNEFDHFRRELRKFERGEPFVPAVIKYRWDALMNGLLKVSLQERAVFLDNRLASESHGRSLMPDGHLLRVLNSVDDPIPGSLPRYISADGEESAFLNDFREYCASSYLLHAEASRRIGLQLLGDSLATIAARISPRHPGLAGFRLQ